MMSNTIAYWDYSFLEISLNRKERIYCFLNGPYLGGAERSFVLQAAKVKEVTPSSEIEFFIPYFDSLDEATQLKNFLIKNGFRDKNIRYYRYSPVLYKLSRSSNWQVLSWFFKVLYGLVITVANLSRLNIQAPDTWWVGGNKVGFVVFLLGIISSFKGRFLWHFRDYPYDKGFYKIIWKLYRLPHPFRLEAIANSYSVSKELKKFKGSFSRIHTLYNPVGKIKFHSNEKNLRLGSASMMAPWKGVQPLVVFALLYEEDLRTLGFNSFEIYGDEIYKTDGQHLGYKKSIENLVRSYNSDFVQFKGLCPPEEIFHDLDIFIHGALKPEPFGRVIVEAYMGGAALISTGLGGSGELIEDGKTGLTFFPYDYQGLFDSIKVLASEKRFEIIQNGRDKAEEINKLYLEQLHALF